MQAGYAHVIEEADKFSSYFGQVKMHLLILGIFIFQEIVGGVLDLPHKRWRNVDMESKQELKNKRDKFKERWENFDWTEEARKRLAET